ncbi:MAG: DUF4430 domain-containing protein [Oscillospiraceae bacterium]|nr:DUF4430 domain-containing protein [Oscillospiraceae bacterium]
MKKKAKVILSLFVITLITMSVFTGCTDKDNPEPIIENSESASINSENEAETEAPRETSETRAPFSGEVSFKLEVSDKRGNITESEITSNHELLGDALREEGIITERDFVNTVNGITADWNTDRAYWAILIDGETATAGIDDIYIDEGSVYALIFTQT